MCGRFALGVDRGQIHDAVPDADDWIDEDLFFPRFNIAPRTYSPVIRRENRLVLHSMKWGVVPHWSKTESTSLSTINARAENLIEGKGMWISMRGRNRCAVICQGYYEWLTKGKDKLPHFAKRKDGKLMLLAGLYDRTVIDDKPLWTFSIVTTDASPSLSWLHDREPVILPTQAALDAWLDTSAQAWTPTLTKLVQPLNDSKECSIECYQVPKEVGKVGTESPSFIEPVKERKDGIQAMFQRQAEGTTKRTKRKRTDSPTPTDNKDTTTEIKEEQEERQQKKLKSPPSTPRKRAVGRNSKSSSPNKTLPSTPEKSRITAFFSKR
ncbi:hypothetical protein AX17_006163 [Amanita inopinata Kibby_2008]|nr:hypothetical protein AX17_006163 [Amanita inopinata Kibby_2008]